MTMRNVLSLLLLGCCSMSHAATFTVTSTGDEPDLVPGNGACLTSAGTCTLRAAIMEANAHADLSDSIVFAIPTSDPNYVQSLGSPIPALNYRYWRITSATPLPALEGGITLDGSTATASPAGNPSIWLEATTAFGSALRILRGGNTVRGLTISGEGWYGIEVGFTGGNTTGATLQGNWIGPVPPFGSVTDGFDVAGIYLSGGPSRFVRNSLIGGAEVAQRNVISGHACGVQILYTQDLSIQGNRIGTNPAGGAARPNATGICANDDIATSTGLRIGGEMAGEGNLVSGNDGIGIDLFAGSDTWLQGNRIGTTANGLLDLANGGEAALRIRGGNGCSVGGEGEAGNLISGNSGIGLHLDCGSQGLAWGNVVGLSANGLPLGNGSHGVRLVSGRLGNDVSDLGNTIAANAGWGVLASVPSTRSVFLHANRVGGDPALAHGNALGGIRLQGADGGSSGQFLLGTFNTVVGNGGPGIEIAVPPGRAVGLGLNTVGLAEQNGQWLAWGNDGPGVLIHAAPPFGADAISGAGLRIGGNLDHGLWVQGSGSLESLGPSLSSVRIGLDPDGGAHGNAGHGIYLSGRVRGARFSGAHVAHNAGAGIALSSAAMDGNSWMGARAWANAEHDIDIDIDGPTANDDAPNPVDVLDDADEGANRRLNYPVLHSATILPPLPETPTVPRLHLEVGVPAHPDNAAYPLWINLYFRHEGELRGVPVALQYNEADYLSGQPVVYEVDIVDGDSRGELVTLTTESVLLPFRSSSEYSPAFALPPSQDHLFGDGFEP